MDKTRLMSQNRLKSQNRLVRETIKSFLQVSPQNLGLYEQPRHSLMTAFKDSGCRHPIVETKRGGNLNLYVLQVL